VVPDDAAPGAVVVPGYGADGVRDAREYVCGGLRAGVGRSERVCGVGDVVDRWSGECSVLFGSGIPDVSSIAGWLWYSEADECRMTTHQMRLETMTAAWLLPIVSCIVAAASGGVVAEALPDPYHALITVVASYVLWGMGVPLAMVILTIYFYRLVIHKLPPNEVIVSVFLPLGPLGQGGYAIMQLGKVAAKVFPETTTLHPIAGDIMYVLGWMAAIVFWGFGLVWLFFAIASIAQSKFPFNMGWWGLTFPIGVFTMATITLGQELSSTFFKALGTASHSNVPIMTLSEC
jgi:tellurite resistance protein TehA-like permease